MKSHKISLSEACYTEVVFIYVSKQDGAALFIPLPPWYNTASLQNLPSCKFLRNCSQIMSALFRGVLTPLFPLCQRLSEIGLPPLCKRLSAYGRRPLPPLLAISAVLVFINTWTDPFCKQLSYLWQKRLNYMELY